MKKIFIIISIFLVATACQKLEDLNKNTKDPSSVSGEVLFPYAQKMLVDQMVNSNVNRNIFRLISQYWTETTYIDESNYNLVNRSIPDNHWDRLYVYVLKNLDEAAKAIKAAPIINPIDTVVRNNKLAIVEVLTVYTYSVLVETFGNVPYSEAINISKPLPKYDDGLTIYEDLINRLTSAIKMMNTKSTSFDNADNMYYGDVSKWLKFASSLKLRMGMLLVDVDNTLAKKSVEEAAPNVIASNDDNAKLYYSVTDPNTNPIYVDLVESGRHDFVPANTFVDTVNTLNDPRVFLYLANPVAFKYRVSKGAKQDSIVSKGISRYFVYTAIDGSDSVVFKQPPYTILASDSLKATFYQGGIYGKGNGFTKWSHIADIIQTPSFPGTLFDYAETEFLLAEAVIQGYNVGGTAESHYNNGIEASILDWGGSSSDVSKYLLNPKVAYATAKGTDIQKIGLQQWIALYNRGFEAWTQWRKNGVPNLVAPSSALSVVPRRFTYPIEEQTLNGTNYKAAGTAIGGDNVATKLFWDKN